MYQCTNNNGVHLEFRTDPSSDHWTILRPSCLPADAFSSQCEANQYHTASVFTANGYSNWRRVTFELPLEALSRLVLQCLDNIILIVFDGYISLGKPLGNESLNLTYRMSRTSKHMTNLSPVDIVVP